MHGMLHMPLDFSTTDVALNSLSSIKNAIDVFEYGSSEYLRSFGMQVNTAAGALSVPARILEPPSLKYGRGSRQPTVVRGTISFPLWTYSNGGLAY